MSLTIRRLGKAKRLSSKKALAHKPNRHGQGRWHNRTALLEVQAQGQP